MSIRDTVLPVRPEEKPGIMQHVGVFLTLVTVWAIISAPVILFHFLPRNVRMSDIAMAIVSRFCWVNVLALSMGSVFMTANWRATGFLMCIVLVALACTEAVSSSAPSQTDKQDPLVTTVFFVILPGSCLRALSAWVAYMAALKRGYIESTWGLVHYAGLAGALVGSFTDLDGMIERMLLFAGQTHTDDWTSQIRLTVECALPVFVQACASVTGAAFVALQATTFVPKRFSFSVLALVVPAALIFMLEVAEHVSRATTSWLRILPMMVLNISVIVGLTALWPLFSIQSPISATK